MRRTFLICDDRPAAEPGVRLAVASVVRHAADAAVRVIYPPADATFEAWVASEPTVTLVRDWPSPHTGWDVKPQALLDGLTVFDEVLWLDSDVILAGDPRRLWADTPADVFVVGEEPHNGTIAGGGRARAQAWGWRVGRDLPAVNSGTLRVTRRHVPLLEAWRDALSDPLYRDDQQRHQRDRNVGRVGDQDVLSALLAGERFAGVEVRLLRSGIDVVQNLGAFGWHPKHRVRALVRGTPPLIHALGPKPWEFNGAMPADAPAQRHHDARAAEVSVYTLIASRVAARAGLSDTAWLRPRSVAGRALRLLDLGRPALRGLPYALVRLLP